MSVSGEVENFEEFKRDFQERNQYQNQFGTYRFKKTHDHTTIVGTLNEYPDDGRIYYVAACPNESRSSWMGSGLPFSTKDQAFDGTPNEGYATVNPNSREFEISLVEPGSYYVGLGTVLVPPFVSLTFFYNKNKVQTVVPLGDPVPFRMLTYPMQFTAPRDSPIFYTSKEVWPRTQEQILRDSAYPNTMPENFWGTRPPV